MPLDLNLDNLAAFDRALPELLLDHANEGRFALVSGCQVDSVWPTQDEAVNAGYDRYGLAPFLAQEITSTPKVYFCSRNPVRSE